jgi:DNA-binding CsgD family transcriptional regulator
VISQAYYLAPPAPDGEDILTPRRAPGEHPRSKVVLTGQRQHELARSAQLDGILGQPWPVPQRSAAERFAGRCAELRGIAAAASDARGGQPRTVLIEGTAGIGKTALLRRALSELTDFRTLTADCAQGAAADQLRAEAERARCGDSDAHCRSGFAASVCSLIGAGQRVAITLDDVHCIDPESAAELVGVLESVCSGALLVIATARVPWRPARADGGDVSLLRAQLLGEGRSQLRLAELSVTDTASLLRDIGTGRSDQTAKDLHAYTGGHPALLSALLDEGLAAAHASPGDLLALSDPRVAVMLSAVAALPAPSRDLLAAMAVSEERWPLAAVGSLGRVADPFEALEPLLRLGLVSWSSDDPIAPVCIRYPFYRDVIYRSLPAARRQALHSRAADLALGTSAWAHRLASGRENEPALTAALIEEAEQCFAAGDSQRAGTLLMMSAAATSDPRQRDLTIRRAAHWWLTLRGVECGPQLEARLQRWPASASRSLLLGLIAEAAGRYPQARAFLAQADDLLRDELTAAASRGEPGQSLLQSDVDLAKALVDADLGDPQAQARTADGVLTRNGLPAAHRAWAEFHSASAAGRMSGSPVAALCRQASLVPDNVIDAGTGSSLPGNTSVRLWTRGSWRLLAGHLRDGIDDLSRMLRSPDRSAADPVAPAARAFLAYGHYLLGEWASAERMAAQAVAALDGHAVLRLRIPVHAIAACIDAGAGREDSAARHLQAAQHWQAECGASDSAVFPALAAATIAQARGNYGRVLAALQPLATDPGAACYRAWWLPLQVETLIGTGQLAAAQRALGSLKKLAGAPELYPGTVAWLEAWLLGAAHDDFVARARFQDAIAQPPARDDIPLHRARLEHEFGRLLMSGRNRRPAIARLRHAYELYRALGAGPFADRCAEDLRACGAQPQFAAGEAAGGESVAVLSSRERKIAYLAAQGLTNQEIASEVFVTAKTVEYHLGNVFAKLGISSRRQLPARLGGPAA